MAMRCRGDVELTVAAAVEPVTIVVTGPNRNRGRAVVHGKGGAGAESTDVGGLRQQLGSAQRSATGQAEQARCQLPGEAFEPTADLRQDHAAQQSTGHNLVARLQLM